MLEFYHYTTSFKLFPDSKLISIKKNGSIKKFVGKVGSLIGAMK
jgi:hypothetical protein